MSILKKISFVLSVVIMSLLVGYVATRAWTEPTVPPPGGNVSAPLDVSSTAQTKQGALQINADFTANRLLDTSDNSYYIDPANTGYAALFAGNVGIGTMTPNARLEVSGNIIASSPTDGAHVATKGYVDAQTGEGGGSSGGSCYVDWGSTSCSAGYTAVKTGTMMVIYSGSYSTNVQSGGSIICSSALTYPTTTQSPAYWFAAQQGYHSSYGAFSHSCAVCCAAPAMGTAELASGSTVIYGTQAVYSGNLGGRSGADSICANQLPSALSGKVTNIKALMSFSTSDEMRDLHTNDSDVDGVVGPYESSAPVFAYNRGWGKFTAMRDDWQMLLGGSALLPDMLNNLLYSSVPTGTSTTHWWSGSQIDGSYNATSCSGYTSTAGSGAAGYRSNNSATIWKYHTTYACTGTHPIMCAAKWQ